MNNIHDYSELRKQIKSEISDAVFQASREGISDGLSKAVEKQFKTEVGEVNIDLKDLSKKVADSVQKAVVQGITKEKVKGIDISDIISLNSKDILKEIEKMVDEEVTLTAKGAKKMLAAVSLAQSKGISKAQINNALSQTGYKGAGGKATSMSDTAYEEYFKNLRATARLSKTDAEIFGKNVIDVVTKINFKIDQLVEDTITDYSKVTSSLKQNIKAEMDAFNKELESLSSKDFDKVMDNPRYYEIEDKVSAGILSAKRAMAMLLEETDRTIGHEVVQLEQLQNSVENTSGAVKEQEQAFEKESEAINKVADKVETLEKKTKKAQKEIVKATEKVSEVSMNEAKEVAKGSKSRKNKKDVAEAVEEMKQQTEETKKTVIDKGVNDIQAEVKKIVEVEKDFSDINEQIVASSKGVTQSLEEEAAVVKTASNEFEKYGNKLDEFWKEKNRLNSADSKGIEEMYDYQERIEQVANGKLSAKDAISLLIEDLQLAREEAIRTQREEIEKEKKALQAVLEDEEMLDASSLSYGDDDDWFFGVSTPKVIEQITEKTSELNTELKETDNVAQAIASDVQKTVAEVEEMSGQEWLKFRSPFQEAQKITQQFMSQSKLKSKQTAQDLALEIEYQIKNMLKGSAPDFRESSILLASNKDKKMAWEDFGSPQHRAVRDYIKSSSGVYINEQIKGDLGDSLKRLRELMGFGKVNTKNSSLMGVDVFLRDLNSVAQTNFQSIRELLDFLENSPTDYDVLKQLSESGYFTDIEEKLKNRIDDYIKSYSRLNDEQKRTLKNRDENIHRQQDNRKTLYQEEKEREKKLQETLNAQQEETVQTVDKQKLFEERMNDIYEHRISLKKEDLALQQRYNDLVKREEELRATQAVYEQQIGNSLSADAQQEAIEKYNDTLIEARNNYSTIEQIVGRINKKSEKPLESFGLTDKVRLSATMMALVERYKEIAGDNYDVNQIGGQKTLNAYSTYYGMAQEKIADVAKQLGEVNKQLLEIDKNKKEIENTRSLSKVESDITKIVNKAKEAGKFTSYQKKRLTSYIDEYENLGGNPFVSQTFSEGKILSTNLEELFSKEYTAQDVADSFKRKQEAEALAKRKMSTKDVISLLKQEKKAQNEITEEIQKTEEATGQLNQEIKTTQQETEFTQKELAELVEEYFPDNKVSNKTGQLSLDDLMSAHFATPQNAPQIESPNVADNNHIIQQINVVDTDIKAIGSDVSKIVSSTESDTPSLISNDVSRMIKGWVEAENIMLKSAESVDGVTRERGAFGSRKNGAVTNPYIFGQETEVSAELIAELQRLSSVLEDKFSIHTHPMDYAAPSGAGGDLEEYQTSGPGLIVGRKQMAFVNPLAVEGKVYQKIVDDFSKMIKGNLGEEFKNEISAIVAKVRAELEHYDDDDPDYDKKEEYYDNNVYALFSQLALKKAFDKNAPKGVEFSDFFKTLDYKNPEDLSLADINNFLGIQNTGNTYLQDIADAVRKILSIISSGKISLIPENEMIGEGKGFKSLVPVERVSTSKTTPTWATGWQKQNAANKISHTSKFNDDFTKYKASEEQGDMSDLEYAQKFYSEYLEWLAEDLANAAKEDKRGKRNYIKFVKEQQKLNNQRIKEAEELNKNQIELEEQKNDLVDKEINAEKQPERLMQKRDDQIDELAKRYANKQASEYGLAQKKAAEEEYKARAKGRQQEEKEYITNQNRQATATNLWSRMNNFLLNDNLVDDSVRQRVEDMAKRLEQVKDSARITNKEFAEIKNECTEITIEAQKNINDTAKVNGQLKEQQKIHQKSVEQQRKENQLQTERSNEINKMVAQTKVFRSQQGVSSLTQNVLNDFVHKLRAIQQQGNITKDVIDGLNQEFRQLSKQATADINTEKQQSTSENKTRMKQVNSMVASLEKLLDNQDFTQQFRGPADDLLNRLKQIQTQGQIAVDSFDDIETEFKQINVQAEDVVTKQQQMNNLALELQKIQSSKTQGRNTYASAFLEEISKAEQLLNARRQNGLLLNDSEMAQIQALIEQTKNPDLSILTANKSVLQKNITKLEKTLRDGALPTGLQEKLKEVILQMKTLEGQSEVTKEQVENVLDAGRRVEMEAGNLGKTLIGQTAQRLQDMNAKFIAQYLSIHDIIRYLRTMFEEIKNIDSALIELKKVTDGLTVERLNISLEHSFETARELGSAVTEVINTTADWARLGYGIEDAEELAKITTLFKNVGDNMTTDTASEYLISTLKGFEMLPEEALSIVDRFNEVANNFAIDTAGIGEALERSSASFNAANTNLSESIALVTTANAVVQNPESVGTTFKTLSARIRGAKTELEELGEEQDIYTESTSKLRNLVKGLTGFDIMADEDTFKSIYDILLGIGQEWDKLTDVERASLGEALAGKRNSNVLFAIMNNIEELEKAYETAENAAGSATKEQENYQKSIQYSVDIFKSQLSELYTKILNSDDVKKFVDFLAQALSYVVKIADKVPTILALGTVFGTSLFLGNSRRVGDLSLFFEGLVKATGVLVSSGGKEAWNSLMDTILLISKTSHREGEVTIFEMIAQSFVKSKDSIKETTKDMANSLNEVGDAAKDVSEDIDEIKSSAISLKSIGFVAILVAVTAAAYGVSKALDSFVESFDEVEDRIQKAEAKVTEYDTKLQELQSRLEEIKNIDTSDYSYNQQQNLQKEAEYVENLTEQYKALKEAQEEIISLNQKKSWTGELKYNPFSTEMEQLLKGDFAGAFKTQMTSGVIRDDWGENEKYRYALNALLGSFPGVNVVSSFIPNSDKNKTQLLNDEIEKYKELRKELNNLQESQMKFGDDSRFQDEIDEVNGKLAESTEQIREYENELMEMKKSIIDEYESGFEEMKKLQEGGSVDLFNRPSVQVVDENGNTEWETVFSHTFSDEKGERWLNFTSIMVDENGNYIGSLTSEDLQKYAEEVISGARTDDLHLQIGAEFTSEEDAVEAAIKIHEEQERYYEGLKKLDLDYIDSNLQSISETFDMLDQEGYASESTVLEKWLNAINSTVDKNEQLLETTKDLGKERAQITDNALEYNRLVSQGTDAELYDEDEARQLLDVLYSIRDVLQFIQDIEDVGLEDAFKNLITQWDSRNTFLQAAGFDGSVFEEVQQSLDSIKRSWDSITETLSPFRETIIDILEEVSPLLAEIFKSFDLLDFATAAVTPLKLVELAFQKISELVAETARGLDVAFGYLNQFVTALDEITNRLLTALADRLESMPEPPQWILDFIEIYQNNRNKRINTKDSNTGKAQLSGGNTEYYVPLPEHETKQTTVQFSDTHDATRLGELLSSGGNLTNSTSWAKIRDELVGMAQIGKLDETTLKNYEHYKDILDALGISAEDADKNISDMIDTINQMAQQNAVDVLNKYKTGIDSLDDAYQKFKKGAFIDASTLAGIQDTFGNLESYQAFEEAVMSGEKNLQEYFDAIVTEYAIQESALGELTEANKDWVKQQLVASGITEASADKAIKQSLERKASLENEIRATLELMNAEVAEKKGRDDLVVSTENLDKLTTQEIALLMQEANMSGEAAQAVALFALKKELAKDASLRNQDDINYLLQLINLADLGGKKVTELKYKLENQQRYQERADALSKREAEFYKTYGTDSSKYYNDRSAYEEWKSITGEKQYLDNWLGNIDTLSQDVLDEIYGQHPELDYTVDLNLDYGGAVDSATKAGSEAAKAFKDTLDKILAMYDAELDAGVETFKNYVNKSRAIIEQYYQEGKITASEYYDYIANLYEKQVSEYDKVISAVQRKIKEQIDSLDKEKESIEESYNLQIEEIQKKIDALQEENDEIDRNMALSRAQYQLARAQHQRTRLMYSESRGFYYEADLQGIADAQENVRKAQLDKTVSDLQKKITTLQDAMKRETDAIDEQIKSLNELSEAWGEVSSTLQHSIEDMRAEEILGKDWEQQIFAERQKILEDFTNQYVALQQAQKDAYLAARQAELDYQPNPTGNSGGGGGGNQGGGGGGGSNFSDTGHAQTGGNTKGGDISRNKTPQYVYVYNGKEYGTETEANAKKQADYNGAYDKFYNQTVTNLKKRGTLSNSEIQKLAKQAAENQARNILNRKVEKKVKAKFSGTDSAKAGDTLVGELGTEIVLDKEKGEATIVDSPTLMKMKGGEKIFNAEETEKILKSKYVPLKNLNPKKFAMLHSFANGTSSPLQNAIAAQAVGIASGLKSGLAPALSTGAGQTINQTFNVSLPNITDSSKASDLFREFEQLQRRATQFFN